LSGTRSRAYFMSSSRGEELAAECAKRQAALAPCPSWSRFLLLQARHERYHAQVFQSGVRLLAARMSVPRAASPAMAQYRRLLEDALTRRELPETLLALQVVLEGLGEVVLERLDEAMGARAMGLARLRRTILRQEHAHYGFGGRALKRCLRTGEADFDKLCRLGQDCLTLTDALLMELGDVFDGLDEAPDDYRRALRGRLPRWLIRGAGEATVPAD
jgi:hypothetical protein